MNQVLSPRILGSIVIGVGLVFGAYLLANLQSPPSTSNSPQNLTGVSPNSSNQRLAIAVEDSDQNGIEDWRDSLVDNNNVTVSTTNATYTPPDTLTEQMALNLFSGFMESKMYAPVSRSPEEVVQSLSESAIEETFVTPYSQTNINILNDWSETDVVNYGNEMARIIESNSIPELRNELELISEVVRDNDQTKIEEIELISNIYQGYRDDSLLVATPAPLAKTHLDLINAYNAIQNDITGLTKYSEDPLKTFIHLKSYEKNISGLELALENVSIELEEYAGYFKETDPATFFILFNPNFNNF